MQDELEAERMMHVRDFLAGVEDKALELPASARPAYHKRLGHWRHVSRSGRSFMQLLDDLDRTRREVLSAATPALMGSRAADKFLHCFLEGLLVATAVRAQPSPSGPGLTWA